MFDGRLRYDVVLEYRRMDQVKAEKGYQGPSVVCGVRFTPVAGHNPERKAVKYIASQNQIEVWLVPIGATRFLVPFRVTSPTPGTVWRRRESVRTSATSAMRLAISRSNSVILSSRKAMTSSMMMRARSLEHCWSRCLSAVRCSTSPSR